MADIKPYERYRRDTQPQRDKEEQIKDYSDFQKAMLNALDNYTAPKKPVKWFFGKDDDDVGALTFATTMSPQLQVTSLFLKVWNKVNGN